MFVIPNRIDYYKYVHNNNGENMLVPTNAKTGNAYSGGNIFELLQTGYTDQVWATYRQWQELGLQVQKGEKGTRLIKMVTVINKKAKDDEAKKKKVPRGFTVFNIAQVEKIVTESDLMEAETAEDFTALSLQQLDQMCERAAK
jgi:antirestriction protein ArdC